mgnify:CR=1 FL=1
MRSIRLLTSGLSFLILGIVFIVMIGTEMMDYSKKGEDYITLTSADFREGMMVEGNLPYNYGSYESIYDEDDKKSVGYFYLIDAGDDGFMGLYTPRKNLITLLDAQADSLEAALQNAEGTYEMPDIRPVYFKGKVTKMDSEDEKFFRQYLGSYGYTDEFIDEYCPLMYIKCVDTKSHPILLVAGIVATVVGIVFILLFVRRKIMGR